jgi:hypothetical protein
VVVGVVIWAGVGAALWIVAAFPDEDGNIGVGGSTGEGSAERRSG